MMEIVRIKRYLSLNKGKKIIVIYNGTRNRRERNVGIIVNIYNNVFTIKDKNGGIKSFSYNDILTKTIQICI